MGRLGSQLDLTGEGNNEIELKEALNCWKAVAILDGMDLEECKGLLDRYQTELIPDQKLYGKFGRGRTGRKKIPETEEIILFADSEDDRTQKTEALDNWNRVNGIKIIEVSYSRGCDNFHGSILGNWKNWEKRTQLKNPKYAKYVKRIIDQIHV